MAPAPPTGHRLLPHVADVILEAWGPTRAACLEAAVRGLVGSFADVHGAVPRERTTLVVEDTNDEEVLVRVLEEVLYAVDANGEVPVDVQLTDVDGALLGFFATAPVDQVLTVGAVPKGVSRSELGFGVADGEWRCHVVVDV